MSNAARFIIRTMPPSVNQLYQRNHRLSKMGRAWKRAAALELMAQAGIGSGPFYWSMKVMIPARTKRGDLMNFEKALTDSLVDAGLAPDDRYLVDCNFKFWRGDHIIVDVEKSSFETWAEIMGASPHTKRIMRPNYS